MATPLYVIKELAGVREGGEVNMLDRRGVSALCSNNRASAWIDKSSATEYMDALNGMGAYISGDMIVDEPQTPEESEDENSGNYSY